MLLLNKFVCLSDPISYDLLLSPISIAVGILYGLVWGFIVKYIPERTDVSIIAKYIVKNYQIIILVIV